MILDERLLRELREMHRSMDAEGKIPPKSKLLECKNLFRDRFGPEKLKTLDGNPLLEIIHDHGNRDSLVYWLEFKNDEELPNYFGGIGGGSALKFGIYKRKETGVWMTGSPQKQEEMTLDQAIERARKHRDQLTGCAELLEKVPARGTDADYKKLQEEIDRVAPDIGNTAWVHKYLSVLYPDKIDAYHNAEYQRFHLIKLLQIPPEGPGRYICAGRYVSLAMEMDLPMNTFAAVVGARNGPPHRYWRIGTSDATQPRNRWDLMRDGEFVAIGWPLLGDLSNIELKQEYKDQIRTLIQEHYKNTPQMVGRQTQEVFNFVADIREGEIVLPSDGATVLGIGRITGAYFYDSSSDFPHRHQVEWLSIEDWKLPNPVGLRTSVYRIKGDAPNLVAIERKTLDGDTPGDKKPISKPITKTIPPLTGIPARIQSILERKGQVILYGPPGTGKTYWATEAARELASRAVFKKTVKDLTGEEIREVEGNGEAVQGLVMTSCFHPAYGYEDFLEGYRPESIDGKMIFILKDGIFKKLCKAAKNSPDKSFYLIIDEINRGDIPRIFGELLTILEKDKRGKGITLPLSGEYFHVPANVYLIGTMNTADRSIALLDTALRRRFGFIELMPDSSLLKDVVVENIPLGRWLEELNRRICEHIGRDARNLQIGHSYLMESGKPILNITRFSRVLREDIIPVLEEYCYENFEALGKILGTGLVDREKKQIRNEIFKGPVFEELVKALLEPCPEIVTAQQLVASEAEQLVEEGEEAETETIGSGG